MKKTLAIFIIVLLLFNSMGYYIVFKTMQYAIKKEIKNSIKQGVPDKNLSLIKVAVNDEQNQAEIEWLEEHEFRYRGQMFDVVRSSLSNDTSYYYCINDKQEEQLFSSLDKQIEHHSKKSDANRAKSRNIYKNIIRDVVFNKKISVRPVSRCLLFSMTQEKMPSWFSKDIPTPPPES
jgi:hypothetical protein